MPNPCVVADDIRFDFYKNGFPIGFIRVASRHGHQTLPDMLSFLSSVTGEGVTVKGEVESPSRFHADYGK